MNRRWTQTGADGAGVSIDETAFIRLFAEKTNLYLHSLWCTQPAPTFFSRSDSPQRREERRGFLAVISASFPPLRCHWVLLWVAAVPRSVQQSRDHQRGLAFIRGSTNRLVPKRNAGLRFDAVNRPFSGGCCARRFRLVRHRQSMALMKDPRHVRTFCPCAIKVTPSVS